MNYLIQIKNFLLINKKIFFFFTILFLVSGYFIYRGYSRNECAKSSAKSLASAKLGDIKTYQDTYDFFYKICLNKKGLKN